MTLQKWIEDRAIHGFPTFSVEDVRAADLCSSEPFYANKDFMEHLRDMDVPETIVGYGKGKHVYPLPVGNM